MKVFLDTDVIFDLLIDRAPFADNARSLFRELEKGKFRAFVCALSFPNIHYYLRKNIGSTGSLKALEKLKSVVAILPVDEKVIAKALASRFSDFEDAIQCFSARQGKADMIVTRNHKDYKNSGIEIFSPKEFLVRLNP